MSLVPAKQNSLEEMFALREEFMNTLIKKIPNYYPVWPVDISQKQSQAVLRDSIIRGVEEVFESLAHLKNSKPHRQTDLPDFDRDAFLEETVDAYNYFFSVLVLLGVTPDELMSSYKKKHEIIMKRIEDGY